MNIKTARKRAKLFFENMYHFGRGLSMAELNMFVDMAKLKRLPRKDKKRRKRAFIKWIAAEPEIYFEKSDFSFQPKLNLQNLDPSVDSLNESIMNGSFNFTETWGISEK